MASLCVYLSIRPLGRTHGITLSYSDKAYAVEFLKDGRPASSTFSTDEAECYRAKSRHALGCVARIWLTMAASTCGGPSPKTRSAVSSSPALQA